MSNEGGSESDPFRFPKEIMSNDVMLSRNSDQGPNRSSEGPPGALSGYTLDNIDLESLDDNSLQNEGYDSCDQQSEDDVSITGSVSEQYKMMMFGKHVGSIPIQKDGRAICEKCGAIGVKHAFYSKSKRFCSLACSRSYTLLQREGKPIPKPKPIFKFPLAKVKICKKDQNKEDWFQKPVAKVAVYEKDLSGSFTWGPHFKLPAFMAAPVSSFKHAPLFECWDNIMVGMKVEVENRDYEPRKEFPQSYWVASVIKVAGYKAQLRYEGFGLDNSEDFWLNLCSEHVHPVGWCASQVKPLVPPKNIQHKYYDWKEFLVKRLTGARTLPADFHRKVEESMVSKFKVGMQLEVVDKNRISSTRIAYVEEVVGGRLHIKYCDADYLDEGFWCHERSPLIHPLNWSLTVGHDVTVPCDFGRTKETDKKLGEHEAGKDIFLPVKNNLADTHLKFKEGMKLEAIDPLNLATVCVATVTKVLRQSYLMIGIDGYNSESGSDWFCHHSSSTSIFPAGFCSLNEIELTPPQGCRGEFKWFDYLKSTKSSAAPVGLFNRELPDHGFKVGMHLEAVDLMEPRLICVGTVTKVVGRLLRVHFDGWDTTYDQWCDCESPDLYPVGWCELVGYPLEPARNFEPHMERKRKPRPHRPRKKKRGRTGFLKGKGHHGKLGLGHESDDDRSIASDVQDVDSRSSGQRSPPEDDNHKTQKDNNHSDNEYVDVECTAVYDSEMIVVGDEGDGRTVNVAEDCRISHSGKTIPRLIDGGNKGGNSLTSNQSVITPELWSLTDVSQFLRINDCGAYCESFSKKKIDGRRFLTLTKEQIVNLTGMKVGPSLKIFDLIQQLKAKVYVS